MTIKFLVVLLYCLLLSIPVYAEEGSADVLLRRAPVPAEPPYQGEVRLVRRGSALVMQSIFDTKVLRHVIAAIRKKELQRWPDDHAGWVDSRHYTEELIGVFELLQERKKEQRISDRYLKILIEFVLEERRSYVAFYVPELVRDGDFFQIGKKELLKKLKTSRTYLYNNLLAIAQDSFRIDVSKAKSLLQPLPEGDR